MSDDANNQFLYIRYSSLDTTYSVDCFDQPELSRGFARRVRYL